MASIRAAFQIDMAWRTNPPNPRNVARMSQVVGTLIDPTSLELLLVLEVRRTVCTLRRVNLDRHRQLSKSGMVGGDYWGCRG
jgi:hypothetical protein